MPTPLDRSDAADAARFRWIINGHGWLLEGFCLGAYSDDPSALDEARRAIDERMQRPP